MPSLTHLEVTPCGMLSVLTAVLARMSENPFKKLSFEFVPLLSSSLCYFLYKYPPLSVDDMKLESFEGLEVIPTEILRQGTKKIVASIRGALIANQLKSFKDKTSLRSNSRSFFFFW